MNPRSVLITGSNRGIGLEFVKQFQKICDRSSHIFACCRKPLEAQALQEISKEDKRIHVLELDVTNYSKFNDVVEKVKAVIGNEGLNILINNAGINGPRELNDATADVMRRSFEVNTIAPLMVTKAFLPLLQIAAQKSSNSNLSCSTAAVINISSIRGSISDNTAGGKYPYKCSKAALNMITRSLSIDLLPMGILSLSFHPGHVRTDMGGCDAPVTTDVSVQSMISVMSRFSKDLNGFMLSLSGEKLPW